MRRARGVGRLPSVVDVLGIYRCPQRNIYWLVDALRAFRGQCFPMMAVVPFVRRHILWRRAAALCARLATFEHRSIVTLVPVPPRSPVSPPAVSPGGRWGSPLPPVSLRVGRVACVCGLVHTGSLAR